jgi:diacylglycerol kinase family enzyme
MSVEPKKWGVIYNPKAGTRKVKKRWKEIKEYMDSKGVDYDYVQSEGFGSVERLAKILANNGYRTIVIVGGDGALNDAINGIMLSDAEDKENIALGMIPNGIGNDFAKYWGLSTEYKPAVDCIINHRLKKIDVGYCNFYDGNEHQRRYFLNAVNIGHDASTDMFIIDAEMHSVIYRPEFLQIISGLWMLIQGRILNHKVVKSYRTRKVKVLRAQNAAVDLDGRLLPKHFPLEVGVLPEKTTLIIPN